MDRFFCAACNFSQTGKYLGRSQLLCPKCGAKLKYERSVPDRALLPKEPGKDTRQTKTDARLENERSIPVIASPPKESGKDAQHNFFLLLAPKT